MTTPALRIVVPICFFCSGASGLVFQVIWVRQFALVFGATTPAIAAVLTAFMSGLALGSFLAGRWIDQHRHNNDDAGHWSRLSVRALWAYALVEAGVGVTAYALPELVHHFTALNRFIYEHIGGHVGYDATIVLTAARFIAALCAIIVPTSLMGATLPLISRYFTETAAEHQRLGLRIGRLYALNTAGAVVGTFAAGFFLLPGLGTTLTNRIAAIINVVVGATVWIVLRRSARSKLSNTRDEELDALLQQVQSPVADVQITPTPAARKAVLWAIFSSGAIAMSYEVLWSRALNMTFGSSVYAFTIVLGTFLIGIALGSALISRIAVRSHQPVLLLAGSHLAIALLASTFHLVFDKLGYLYLFLLGGKHFSAETVLFNQLIVAICAMLPATIVLGAVLPLTIRICARDISSAGRDVGTIYAVNTLGAVIGSALVGFAALPLLQLQGTLRLAICGNILIAAILFFKNSTPFPRRKLVTVIAMSVSIVVVLTSWFVSWNKQTLVAGFFRPAIALDVIRRQSYNPPELVFYHDGPSTTVTVEKWADKHLAMKNNGKVDASTGSDMPTQILVGLLPLLIHPNSFAPQTYTARALLVGLASGVSAGAMLQYPLRALDVVELESSIARASHFFDHVNHRPLSDARTTLIIDDGRNYLSATTAKYDVIVNEPSNPWLSGVSNLFTKDYFEIGRQRLNARGVFCTWVQAYEMSPDHVKAIYRSFAVVFPYAYAISAASFSSDTFLIGSNEPLRWDLARIERAFSDKTLAAELRRASITTPHQIVALTLLGAGELNQFTHGAKLNTDDNGLIEFGAPKDLFSNSHFKHFVASMYGQHWPYGKLDGFIANYTTEQHWAGLAFALLQHGRLRAASHIFEQQLADSQHPESVVTKKLLQMLQDATDQDVRSDVIQLSPSHVPALQKQSILEQQKSIQLLNRAQQALMHRAFATAYDLIQLLPEALRDTASPMFRLQWGILAYRNGKPETCQELLEPLTKDAATTLSPELFYYLGQSYYLGGDYAKGIAALQHYLTLRDRQLATDPKATSQACPSIKRTAITSEGCCLGQTLCYRDGEVVRAINCAANPSCGWRQSSRLYNCGTDGRGDPTKVHPKNCATR